MTSEDFAAIAQKLRKLHWLEAVHSTFIVSGSKAEKELRVEFKETRRLQLLCEQEVKQHD